MTAVTAKGGDLELFCRLLDQTPAGVPVPGWESRGACRVEGVDSVVFYPMPPGRSELRDGYDQAVSAAQAVCRGCGVQAECLADAMARGERYGVWGGASEQQRDRLRRHHTTQQRREQRPAA